MDADALEVTPEEITTAVVDDGDLPKCTPVDGLPGHVVTVLLGTGPGEMGPVEIEGVALLDVGTMIAAAVVAHRALVAVASEAAAADKAGSLVVVVVAAVVVALMPQPKSPEDGKRIGPSEPSLVPRRRRSRTLVVTPRISGSGLRIVAANGNRAAAGATTPAMKTTKNSSRSGRPGVVHARSDPSDQVTLH